MSIRLKITLPYLILATVAAVVGVYLAARIVANPNDILLGISTRRIYVIIFFPALILSVTVIGFAISRQIVKPMYSLVTTSQAIAAGDLSQRAGIRSTDEIGYVAGTFDEMVSRLQERTVELERTNQILRNIDKTKSNFIQISAHELRTPLTMILGYSALLEEDTIMKNNPELLSLAKGILEGSERMTDIIDTMLDISRIDSNTLSLRKTGVQIDPLIKKVIRIFSKAFEERNIQITAEGFADLPLVPADPDLLQKVFYHIIMNAIKFTPNGGSIYVTGKHLTLSEPQYVEIAVRDTGIGIDPALHQVIFEKFNQTGDVLLHSSGKTKFKGGGPGLGLAIARGIVEAHGGRIWVESPGYDETKLPGSTFYVCLPVGREN